MSRLPWFQTRPQAPTAPQDDAPDGPTSTVVYVDWLLKRMLRQSLFTMTVTASTPLPEGGDDDRRVPRQPPNHQAVINRLKVMAGLSPIVYAEPKDAKFEVVHGLHALVHEIRFDDRASPPACTLRLRVRRA